MRIGFLLGVFMVGVVAVATRGDELDARAKRVHNHAVVVDTHIDLPMTLAEKWADMRTAGATAHFDLPRARAGGLSAAFMAIYTPAHDAERGTTLHQALEQIDVVDRVVAANPADLVLATAVAEIRNAKSRGKIALLLGLEGGHAIEDSIAALRVFHRLGVRYVTLTHTGSTHWADSSGAFWLPDYDPVTYQVHHGLNDFGREVVREMNRLGVMVDVSHVSDETIDDVLAASRAPIFASHSSCRALCNVPRNLTDEQIKRIAAAGGVVMINVSSFFLDQQIADRAAAEMRSLRPAYEELKKAHPGDQVGLENAFYALIKDRPRPRTPWTTIVDHIEHVIAVAGPDAVGLGTDFDGISDPPEGFEDVSCYPRLTAELLRRGHSEEEVRKVLGENFLRFFARVEAVSRSLATEPASTARRDT